jgi:hypothetical protein
MKKSRRCGGYSGRSSHDSGKCGVWYKRGQLPIARYPVGIDDAGEATCTELRIPHNKKRNTFDHASTFLRIQHIMNVLLLHDAKGNEEDPYHPF